MSDLRKETLREVEKFTYVRKITDILWFIVPENSYKTRETPCCCLQFCYKSNRPHEFYGFPGIINQLGMLGEHSESLFITHLGLVIYKLFSRRSPNIPRGLLRREPIENAIYC